MKELKKLNYSDIVKDNGFLSNQGEELLNEQFLPAVKELLTIAKTENEIRTLAGILSNLIGKEVANTLLEDNKEKQQQLEKIYKSLDPFDFVFDK